MAEHNRTIAVLGTRGFPGVQGGVETHCQHLYRLMPSWHVRVYRRKPYLTEHSASGADNMEFVDWASTRIQGLEAAWHTLRATVHCMVHRPALVHVHNMGPALLALPVRWVGIPLVMTYHSVNYEHSKWSRPARWLLRLSERLTLRHCDHIIFVNRLRMVHFGAAIAHKSTYLPNGVEVATPTADTSLLQQYGIRAGEYVLAVGRIAPEKGLEHLVVAANRSSRIGQVVIAGDCDHGSHYMQRLKTLDTHGKVVFTGYATGQALRQLYSHARLLALPSLSEGFAMTLLEAMAYGLPIVASDLDANRLVPLPSDSYCTPGDATSLQAAIERTLEHDDRRAAYDLRPFDWHTIARRTEAIFDALVKPKS